MKIYEPTTQLFFEIDPKRISGEEAMTCPKCSHERKKKNDKCFSWNHEKKVGRCSHCEARFVIKSEMQQEKVYTVPEFNNRTDLSKSTVDYFFGRGISQSTINHFKITEAEEYMPQVGEKVNTLQFNFFRNDKLVNVKYRGKGKIFKLVSGAELIMYNVDSIRDADECIVTEGEIDAMSWHEAGHTNVVSVPNGASKGQKLDYIDNCFEYFEGKKRIYLSTDNDEPGRALRDELARRFGYDKCYKIEYGDYKDANEYLQAKGAKELSSLISQAKEFPIEGVFTIDDNWDDIEDIYQNGLPKGAKTGDEELDNHIGFMPGELTMVTGIPGHGKSIYLDQISLGLSFTEAWRWGVCSPESYPMPFYFTRLIKRIVGKKFSKNNITRDDLQEAKNWITDKYHLIMPKNGFTLDEILEKARQLVLRKGIKGLILDPWNRIENTKPHGMSDSEWIVNCLLKIITFAQQNGVHVFLVAHPTKMLKEKDSQNYVVPNLYSISGSAHFFNMCQNGITVYRNYESGKTEVHVQKVKWEHLGKIGMIEYTYSEENARFYPRYGMKQGNWLKDEKPMDNSFESERKEYRQVQIDTKEDEYVF